MTMCNVKGVTHSDDSTKNYHPNLRFPSVLKDAKTWSSLFWFSGPQLYCLIFRLFPAKKL